MTNETDLKNAVTELSKNSRETALRLEALSQVMGVEINSESWDKITADDIAATALFGNVEADAIIFAMTKGNNGVGLEKAVQFFTQGR